MLTGELEAAGREPVKMAWRTAVWQLSLPARLEDLTFGKAHEDRIQRPGLKPGLERKLVAVAPLGRLRGEGGENPGCL